MDEPGSCVPDLEYSPKKIRCKAEKAPKLCEICPDS